MSDIHPRNLKDDQSFEEASQANSGGSLVGDLIAFMSENAKWWLIPILVVLGLLAVLIVLGGTGALPFIYTLF